MTFVPETDQPGPWSSKFAVPSEPTKMTVTYDMAGDWLDNRFRPSAKTHKQRKSAARTSIEKYALDMRRNKWRLTHEGIAFDVNGWLQDGWHRMQALRLANEGRPEKDVTIEVWVYPNQDPDNFDVIGVGTPRRAAQLYQGPHGSLVTSAVRYLTPGKIGKYNRMLTVSEQVYMADQWSELAKWASSAATIARRTRTPSAQHLAILAQAERSPYASMIPDWVKAMTDGWNIPQGDARGHLRNKNWNEEKISPEDIYGFIAKAWLFYVGGKKVQLFKFSVTETSPDVPGFYGVPLTLQPEGSSVQTPSADPAAPLRSEFAVPDGDF